MKMILLILADDRKNFIKKRGFFKKLSNIYIIDKIIKINFSQD